MSRFNIKLHFQVGKEPVRGRPTLAFGRRRMIQCWHPIGKSNLWMWVVANNWVMTDVNGMHCWLNVQLPARACRADRSVGDDIRVGRPTRHAICEVLNSVWNYSQRAWWQVYFGVCLFLAKQPLIKKLLEFYVIERASRYYLNWALTPQRTFIP